MAQYVGITPYLMRAHRHPPTLYQTHLPKAKMGKFVNKLAGKTIVVVGGSTGYIAPFTALMTFVELVSELPKQ